MGTLIWLGIGFGIILVLAGVLWKLAGKKSDWSAEEILKREG